MAGKNFRYFNFTDIKISKVTIRILLLNPHFPLKFLILPYLYLPLLNLLNSPKGSLLLDFLAHYLCLILPQSHYLALPWFCFQATISHH